MTPALASEGMVKRYGPKVAVDGVGFHIDHGESDGLVGPNGAGKTTTISMVVGLLRPDAGTVRVFGTHFWTMDALLELSRPGTGVGSVFLELTMLAGFAIALRSLSLFGSAVRP
jgi:ABC-type multidrug transport system ATPase subunit